MLFRRGIEDLHDDEFEGSKDEDSIFKEVFFGHENDKTSKKCLVTGAINFENENKLKVVSLGCNSDNSVMTTHIDFQNMEEYEEFTILARNDPDVEVKRRKVLLEEQVDAKNYLEKVVNSSIPSKEIDSCLIQPTTIVTCRLVESSGQGFKSSCYLLKGAIGEVADKNASKSRLSSSDTNDQKGNDASAAIASPVSQESHVSKLLVIRPKPIQCSKQKWKDSSFVELDEDELLSPPKESTTDPLNHYCGFTLIGRPIREFYRAWNMCGQKLVADANYVVGKCDGIQWTTLAEFQSDFSDTLIEIEEQLRNLEPATALAHWWFLLDPFAKVAFIDKSLRYLKEGKLVKTTRSVVDGFYFSDDTVPSRNEVITANQISKRFRKKSSNLLPFSCQTNNLYASSGGSENIMNTKEHNKFSEMKVSAPYGMQEISEISVQLKSNMEESYGSCIKSSYCSFEDY
ncbi:hypothetical protein L1987_70652 [Smallanthus sonchifolius]|uniref:Uncharacterized protein n=1 Tax=Smallanthus sonchifolius TaxID=185202 RepID=A0ACB9AQW6_9ASTR|nr:hypothetical protein L1987_70652 [Smallanthus sonchifolius]